MKKLRITLPFSLSQINKEKQDSNDRNSNCDSTESTKENSMCNSSSSKTKRSLFKKKGPEKISSKVSLGAGCFWGPEEFIMKDFQQRFPGSIKRGKVGFMAPDPSKAMRNPTYDQVCSGVSGHVEVVHLELNNPTPELYEELLKFFYLIHDPTTKDRQGLDIGPAFASYIFTTGEEQERIARRIVNEVQLAVSRARIIWYEGKKIETIVAPATRFVQAERIHQRYLEKHPNVHCNHYYRADYFPSLQSEEENLLLTQEESADESFEFRI